MLCFKNTASKLFLCLSFVCFLSSSTKAADCTPGNFNASTGQDPCTACEAGTFSDTPGATECQPCAVGSYQDTPGSSSCSNCAAGTFINSEGSTSCIPCDIGTFSDEAASSCTDCAVGTFADVPNSSSCTDCEAGTFQDTTAASSCIACDANTFSPAASSSCEACATGSYSDAGSSACASLCGDEITFTDEDCDDGSTDDLDGCDSTCQYENYTDLASTNSDVDFFNLQVNKNILVEAPLSAQELTNCTCAWAVSPTSTAHLTGSDECSLEMKMQSLGQANLSLEVTCTDSGLTSYNQTLLITLPAASNSQGSCQLNKSKGNVSLFLLTFFSWFIITLGWRQTRRQKKN